MILISTKNQIVIEAIFLFVTRAHLRLNMISILPFRGTQDTNPETCPFKNVHYPTVSLIMAIMICQDKTILHSYSIQIILAIFVHKKRYIIRDIILWFLDHIFPSLVKCKQPLNIYFVITLVSQIPLCPGWLLLVQLQLSS